MKEVNFSTSSTRRQFLAEALTSAGALALAGNTMCAPNQYAPRIVCNMFYWCQLFSTPFNCISSSTYPLKAPSGQKLVQPTNGIQPSQTRNGRATGGWRCCPKRCGPNR